MRKFLLLLLILSLAGCTALPERLQQVLVSPPAPSAGPEAYVPQAYPPSATQVVMLPLVVASGGTPTPEPGMPPAPPGFDAPPAQAAAWSLGWQAYEEDFPEEYWSLAISRPVLQPETPGNAWVNQTLSATLQAEIDAFHQMAVQGIFDQEFPGHLWIGFAVPGSAASQTVTPQPGEPAVPVMGISAQPLPEPQPASQVLVDFGHPLLSLLMGVSPYTGGAHPGYYHVPIILDLAAGRQIELADLFLPGSDYLARLSELSIEQLRQREYVFPEVLQFTPSPEQQGVPSGAGPEPSNYRVWAPGPQGLWIVFDPYQVAAWAAGPQYVLIPYESLADILDPAGPLGNLAK